MDAAAAKRWAKLLAPVLFATALWLNQGVPRARFLAMLGTIKAAPSEHVALAAWYPFAFLYHRAIDEQMYFEMSGAMLGKETDRIFLHEVRGHVPPPFDEALPPADGKFHAPYTEVPLEYPPAAVPLILLPRLFTDSFPVYAKLFGALMALFLTGAFALVFAALRSVGEAEALLSKRAWLAALLCVLEGSLVIQRLDAVAAFFLSLAFYAAVKRKPVLLGFAGGAAFAVKFVPALLLPVLLAADPEPWRDIRNWTKAAASSLVTVVAMLGPIFLAPGALTAMLAYHEARGLQVETTFATVLGVVRFLGGGVLGSAQSFGSANLSDGAALLLAKACTPLTLVAIAGVAHFAFYAAKRGISEGETALDRTERMARALFAATVLLWLASKVLSPQYFTWGLPLVLAIPFMSKGGTSERGTSKSGTSEWGRGKKAVWAFALALLVTQIYMRGYYEAVANQEPIGIFTMVLRQALLAAAAAITLSPLLRPLTKART